MWTTGLQQEFDTLTELFEHVGLHTNVFNMVSMACQPCHVLGGHYAEAYGLRMTGEGQTYQDRLRQIV